MSDTAFDHEEPIVEVCDLTRRFGAKLALANVNLTLPAGSVLGLVGENGAGKTTLIKHLLGLLRAQSGAVYVFGRDPVTDPVGVLSRIGYLSEDAELPGWMRVAELMRYSQAFYPTWDEGYAERLREEFDLDARAVIRTLSKGQRARVGLLVALAYRPELLVLDEPSSGLDPIVRRDVLAAVIRTLAVEGRSVLFSSHLLSEVEQIADRVAMIQGGRLAFCETLDDLKEGHARLILRFPVPRSAPPRLEGALAWQGDGREWTVLCAGSPQQWEVATASLGAQIVQCGAPTLDEIFVARARSGREGP